MIQADHQAQSPSRPLSRLSPLSRLLPCALAVLALGAAQATHAAEPAAQPIADADTLRLALSEGPLTREQVREELRQARALNLLSPGGEGSDTVEVLDARERFYSQQRAVVEEHYAALQQAYRLAALQQEQRAADIEAEQRVTPDSSAAASPAGVGLVSSQAMPDGAPSADQPAPNEPQDALPAAAEPAMPAESTALPVPLPGDDGKQDALDQPVMKSESDAAMPDPVLETVYLMNGAGSEELLGYLEWSGEPTEAITVLLVREIDGRDIDVD